MKFYFILLLTSVLFSCERSHTRFQSISEDKTGINFSNTITENDSVNILSYEYVYNGGGVGIGDFNKDGLLDIYFSGNMVSNKLYLNKGGMKFEDITQQSGTGGEGEWYNGVTVVDINNDGWPDIFVSATKSSDPRKRKKILYINRGLDKNGIPVFDDEATDYGLGDTSYSTSAAFFDYDNDGDLDMFLLVNAKLEDNTNPSVFSYKKDSSRQNISKLFQNNWDKDKNHPYFTDVSEAAGINKAGYGLGVNICDINNDGWKDIFVSNDYLSNDLLWINNGNGTFTDKSREYFKHTSFSSMGNDIEDLNNDGLSDIIELDMSPADNYRKKMMVNPNTYQFNLNFERYNYQYQFERNTLQLNRGNVNDGDTLSSLAFSEIAPLSGIDNTDWSWTPMVADFDNDSYKDIIITNGFPKDLSDHDFISFRNRSSFRVSKEVLIQQMPVVKLKNYAFHNNHDLTFTDVSSLWGIKDQTFSNGAAYADLDNDGDLDYVVNNINNVASVYKNNSRETDKANTHYLNIQFQGDSKNLDGLGAFAEIYYNHGKHQIWENTPYRGYLSTVEDVAHFGLGQVNRIDSLVIRWPNNKKQTLRNIKADQRIIVNINDALTSYYFNKNQKNKDALFTNVTNLVDINYTHKEVDFIDFNVQKLLPHKFSQFGPGMAAGDINGDGTEDLITGGSFYFSGQEFLQQKNGKFIQKDIIKLKDSLSKNTEDEGILLFDADGDSDLDLYIASGSYEVNRLLPNYQDRFYLNDGKGNFTIDSSALPHNFTSKFCVRAIDYDKDGDLDLFVSGRVDPWNYPKPVSSFILRNDTKKNGVVKFTDVTSLVAKDLQNIGLVCDAVFTDFNNDGWPDLILAGEWMPITFFENDKGVFKDVTKTTGINKKNGWWNTIAPGDFDNDGDMDYIVGNLGRNSYFQASDQYPVSVISKDFDSNGTYDAFLSLYLPASEQDHGKKSFPAGSRDEIIKQLPGLRKRYEDYQAFAHAPMDSLFTKQQMQGALSLHANYFSSVILRNDGKGRFTMITLPIEAQVSVLNGISVDDYDGDGNLDAVINGNDFGTEPTLGRYDALDGLFLKGNGKNSFKPLSILQSGIYIPGDGKALVSLKGSKGTLLLAASQNKGPLKIYELNRNKNFIALLPFDESAIITYKDGKKQKREFTYGSSFLSQSGRHLAIDASMKSITVRNNLGGVRTIEFAN